MSTLLAHLRLFERNRKLGWLTFILAAIFLGPPVIIAAKTGRNPWWFTMANMILLPAILAGFTGETQKNLLSCGNGYLLPGLRPTLLRTQVFLMALVGIAAFLIAYFDPGLASFTTGAFLPALALTSLTLAIYALVLLADWFIIYATSLASLLVLPYFLFIKLAKDANITTYQHIFTHSAAITLVCTGILFATYWILTSGYLARRMAEQPYISVLDLYRPAKARQFRNRRAAHHGAQQWRQRPLQGWMDRCLNFAARARSAGNESTAACWEALHLGLSTSVARQGWKFGFLSLIMLLFTLATGYFDSRRIAVPDDPLYSWFSAFPFAFALVPVIWCQFLDTAKLSLPRSRATTIKAGYRIIGWITLAVVILSALVMALFYLAAPIMPTWKTAGNVWAFLPPQNPHIPFLPLLVLPAMLVVYLLWPKSGAEFVLSIAGMEILILFHAVLNMGGYGWPLVVVLAVSGISWAALPFLWRRRVGGDLS